MIPLLDVAYAELVIHTNDTPIFLWASLICQEDECGWKKGDVVNVWGHSDNIPVQQPNVYIDKYGLHFQVFYGGGKFWVLNPDDSSAPDYGRKPITNDKWKLAFRCIMEKA